MHTPDSGKAFCVGCKAEIDANVTFCPHCGADQRPPGQRPAAPPAPPVLQDSAWRKSAGGLAVGCGCTSMCGFGSVLMGLGMSSPGRDQQPGPLGLLLYGWQLFLPAILFSTLGLGIGFGLLFNKRVGWFVALGWLAFLFLYLVIGQMTTTPR